MAGDRVDAHWLDLSLRDCIAYYSAIEKTAKDDTGLKYIRRNFAQLDLYYLLVKVLGREDMMKQTNPHGAEWLYQRCREVQRNPNGNLDLWAREHYKSTIITFGLTIFDIINDPDVTIGIFSLTRPLAKGFLRQIKQELESNTDLKYLFPDIFYEEPKSAAPKWSEDDGIVVKRKSNPKEATVEAWGLVDAMPTGKHFKLRLYDDVVTERSVTTPEMIKKTTYSWELSDNLGAQGGYERYVGTRYNFADTYAEMKKRKVVKIREYPACPMMRSDDGADWVPDFDQAVLMPPALLRDKRRKQGVFTFACQMLQNPVADSVQGFKEDWLEYWDAENWKNLNIVILVDPASAKKTTSDYTAMMVVGIGGDGYVYVIDMVRDRLNLKERTAALFHLVRTYSPIKVGYEKYGLQSDIEHIKYVQEQENFRFKISELGGGLKKEDRIRRLVPLFEEGKILLPRNLISRDYQGQSVNLTTSFVEEEYLAFPVGAHDDMIDCLARVMDEEMRGTAKPSPKPKKFNAIREAQRQMRRNRPVV